MYRPVGAVVPRPQPQTSPEENTNNSPAETPGTAAPSGQGGGDQATTPSYEPSDDSSYGGDSGYGYGGESSGGGGQGQGTSTSPPVTPLDNKQDPPPQAFNPGSDSASELKTVATVLSNLLGLIPAIGQFFYLWFQSLFGDRHPVPMPKLGDVDVDKLIRDLLTTLMRDPAAVERAIRQAIADATPEQREQLRQLWSQITDNLDRIDDPDIREQLRQAIDRYGPVLEDALRDPQQPPRPTTPSDSPDPESPGEPRQPGDTPDSPDSPRQPGDAPEPPPTEAPDQPTPPGDLPDPDTSPHPGPDEPTSPGDTPNPDKGPTAPGETPPSPPEPNTPQTPDTPAAPDTPDTPGEPSTPSEVPERTPPNWWQPPTPPDLDTPDFRNPPDPDYAQPPTDQPDLADWLAAVIASITPPTPVEPEGQDGAPSDEQLRDQFEEVIQEIADAATAAVGLQALSDGPLNAQRFGTEVHTLFKELMQLYLETNLDQWFGPDFILNLEQSVLRGAGLSRDDAGRYTWAPYGSAGSARPDVVITRLVTDTAGNAIETVFLILDVKTGNADISNTWRDAVSRATDSAADIIRSIKPGVPRVLSRPPSTTTPPP